VLYLKYIYFIQADPATGFDGRLRSRAAVHTRRKRRDRSASFSSCATVGYDAEDDVSGEELSEEEEEPIGRRTRNAKGRSLGLTTPSRDTDRP